MIIMSNVYNVNKIITFKIIMVNVVQYNIMVTIVKYNQKIV